MMKDLGPRGPVEERAGAVSLPAWGTVYEKLVQVMQQNVRLVEARSQG